MSVVVYITVQEGRHQLVIDGPLKLLAQLVQAMQVQSVGNACEQNPVLPSPQAQERPQEVRHA